MEKVPTVDEIIEKHFGDKLGLFTRNDVAFIALETAKLHVEQALKEASENAETKVISEFEVIVDIDSILNSYPLSNIK